jgi:uncharacterized protein (DUF4415 family)
MTDIVYKLDIDNPPPLTKAQKKRLEALEGRGIDYSDLPPLGEAFWKNALRNPFYKPVKKSTTVRLDADVLAWLKSPGRGYQTRMNDILRRVMLASAAPRQNGPGGS